MKKKNSIKDYGESRDCSLFNKNRKNLYILLFIVALILHSHFYFYFRENLNHPSKYFQIIFD
jgi:hypothetical protein